MMFRRPPRPANQDDRKPAALVREGERVDLRRHRVADEAAFVSWYTDAEIATLLRHDLKPLAPAQARQYFHSIILPASAARTAWAVYDHGTNALIGTTAITGIDPDDRSCLFRIVIGDKGHWGHGYGTEATRLVAAEAFMVHDLNAVRLEVFAHNPRAIHAYERAGFLLTDEYTEWAGSTRLDIKAMVLRRSSWDQAFA